MAYKFQIGAAILSGSTTFKEGLSANDASISNVNDIAVDSISADGNEIDISLTDNQAAALEIKEGSNTYMKFVTTNGSEAVEVMKNIDIGANDFTINEGKIKIGGTAVTSTAAELNALDGFADAGYDATADSVVFFDATDSKMKREAANDFAGAIAGDGLAASSGALAVQVSGALKIASDKVGITGSFAGAGLEAGANEGADSMLTMNIDLTNVDALGGTGLHQSQDHFMFSDNGTIKKITFSNLEDAIFGNVSSDATIAAGGALTIANDAVDNNKLANIARGSIKVGGASNAPTDLDAKTSGQILVGDGTDLVSVAVSGDATLAANGALSLDAAQTNITSLLATDIKIGEDDETKIDFETPDEIHFYAANAEQVYVADGIFGPQTDSDVDLGSNGVRWKDLYVDSVTVTDDVTIAGNLTVSGTTVEVDAAFVVTASIQFEGSVPDGNELTLTTANPTADRTVTIPDLSGHVPLLAGAISTANVTADEFALLDGGSSVGTSAIASGDGFLHNDGGVMKHTDVDTLATFVGANLAVTVATLAHNGTASVGVNYFADMGSDGEDSVALPASPSVGNSVKIKAPSDCSSDRYITINRAGSHTIDGETSIRLESPFAAVELVYVANNLWRVF